MLRALRERAGARPSLIRVPVLERDWTVPLRREVGLPHFSDPEHKVEYDPKLLRAELDPSGLGDGRAEAQLGRDLGRSVSSLKSSSCRSSHGSSENPSTARFRAAAA